MYHGIRKPRLIHQHVQLVLKVEHAVTIQHVLILENPPVYKIQAIAHQELVMIAERVFVNKYNN